MVRQSRAPLALLLAAVFAPELAHAAQVRGSIDSALQTSPERTLGYTRTRVALPSRLAATRRPDIALFLRVKESLPIPQTAEPFRVRLAGLRIVPAIAACVVDGKVSFTNEDRARVTVLIDQKPFGTLDPGESKTYDCVSADAGFRRITIKEWPHMRGSVFVGDVGIVAEPGNTGAFAMTAPQGKYELDVLGDDTLLAKMDVDVGNRDVDVGRIAAGKGTPAPTNVEEASDAPKGDAPKPGKAVPKTAKAPAVKRKPPGAADKPEELHFDVRGAEP
jgi:hypothetical protein